MSIISCIFNLCETVCVGGQSLLSGHIDEQGQQGQQILNPYVNRCISIITEKHSAKPTDFVTVRVNLCLMLSVKQAVL